MPNQLEKNIFIGDIVKFSAFSQLVVSLQYSFTVCEIKGRQMLSCPKVLNNQFLTESSQGRLRCIGVRIKPEYRENPTCDGCPGAVELLRKEAQKNHAQSS